MQIDFGGGSEIGFERKGKAGLVKLTRTSALNALTHKMILALDRALQAWETDPDVACVILEGEGRAFCAGGDVVAAYKAGQDGTPAYDFFRDEYRLNARIGRFPKPYISLLNGIVMGGGAGISVHGSHRIVTETHFSQCLKLALASFRMSGEVPSCLISMIISATILHSPATAFAGVIVCKVELPRMPLLSMTLTICVTILSLRQMSIPRWRAVSIRIMKRLWKRVS